MTDPFATSYREALKAMDLRGPRRLHALVAALTEDLSICTDDDSLCAYLTAVDPNDSLRIDFAVRLATWDAAEGSTWTDGTPHNTPERRARITSLLGLGDKAAALVLDMVPIAATEGTIIEGEWSPWYTESVRHDRDFYWDHYRNHLLHARGFDPKAVAALDASTTKVVERLANPAGSKRHQAKGLVVGYVQSGKTANFTGVIAKAIDAGYRLFIVLSGSANLLRTQTQRRLDMELVGRENLLRGISEHDTEAFDYHADRDWRDGKFVRHGVLPREVGQPDVVRLTTRDFDYQSLQQGISALDFERPDRTRPLFDELNLRGSHARLVVVKKNNRVLAKLVKDLRKITTRLADIPALIIDDESDQASPNTSNPKKWAKDQKERTSINQRISELLTLLPRAQYVGYTATPFANVFVDPSDTEDIFPSNFILSLDRPPGYMGAADFHDLDADLDDTERNFASSKEKAHVRPLPDDPADESHLRQAIDAFVLTGAIKLYRQDRGEGAFRHHTMLVHHAMHRAVHSDKATEVRQLWETGGYFAPASAERLCKLYEDDIRPVSQALADGDSIPDSYEELTPYVAQAIRNIGQGGDPVIVVNSEKSLENEQIDFDQRGVWKILVGGNSLARGFTVEGLTISYYRRLTKQQDTLMQMGRWFGFRPHYRDLVRLYITPSLHTAFEASCRDEEHFRTELRRYATPVDGKSQLTPAQVPPLVAQHLDWLKPTAANKMYNADLAERRSPGIAVEPRRWPANPKLIESNTRAFQPLLDAAKTYAHLYGELPNAPEPDSDESERTPESWNYHAWIGRVSHPILLSVMQSLRLATDDALTPDLRWLTSLTPEQISGWVVILPQHKGSAANRRILGHEPISVHTRTRQKPDYYGGISKLEHRGPGEVIKRVPAEYNKAVNNTEIGEVQARRHVEPRSGSILIYPVVDRAKDGEPSLPGQAKDELHPHQVTLAFRLVAPESALGGDKRLVLFEAKVTSRRNAAIVDKHE
ncbi:Z1 domain-containing protein [Micromonospora sp. NPDC049175]|uniref:Z1 domain-containing protein n=1 Tax=Micromonospora sp. NPDC049175 TaxID=3364266 RepID=UPI00371A33DF